jgi:exodeoxyribonuclease V alpha subunit
MTVHKAQGSEFDAIALILPDKDLPLLTREVVYTGISRARHGAVVIGRPEMLHLAISRKLERYSGLDEMMAMV